MSIYNCEKYLKLILDGDGKCALNGEKSEALAGFPVAGESNAFAVEVTFPNGYDDYSKTVYLSFGDKNYRLIMSKSDKAATGVYYFLLPSVINAGGALGITVAASKGSANAETETLVKWKPFYVTVLDAPVTYVSNINADHDMLQTLQEGVESVQRRVEDLDASTVKKNLVNFIPHSFTETRNGAERIISIDGKNPATGGDVNKQVRLSLVTDDKNGDMSPEMLEKLNNSNQVINELGEQVITNVEVKNDNGVEINFARKNLKTGDLENISATIPVATASSSGLLSADDKYRVNNMVVVDETGHIDESYLPPRVVNNVVELDESGHISEAYLPSNVYDVKEFASTANFPTAGKQEKIYVALDTNKIYRWAGKKYVEISARIELGDTEENAFPGHLGKLAYEHVNNTGNPHGLKIYRHFLKLIAGTANKQIVGYIEVYNTSQYQIKTVSNLAISLKVYSGTVFIPIYGSALNSDYHTVICIGGDVTNSSITLHGMYFGYNSGEGMIERVSGNVTTVLDAVSEVL